MIGFLLFLVAVIIFIIALPISIIYIAFDVVFNLLGKIALSIDMTGNVLLTEVFNDILITKTGYKFGNRKETISSVLGKNQKYKTLKRTGKFLCRILDRLDPQHCEKSIDHKV